MSTPAAWPERGEDRHARLAHQLCDGLSRAGTLRSPLWREAFGAVPRVWFVPDQIFDIVDGRWAMVDRSADTARWEELVFSDVVCVTRVDDDVPVSSNSAPSLVAATLEALSPQPAMSVLEIGTGTGWTAALLCHALGADRVTTIDVRNDLVAEARSRLADHGWTPWLDVADGWLGYQARAPYDRLLATCAVRQVPESWIRQTRLQGCIVVNIRGDLDGGLAVLTKTGDTTLEGRFLPDLISFMIIQTPNASEPDDANLATLVGDINNSAALSRPTLLSPQALDGPFGFLAQLHLPGVRHLSYTDLPGQDGARPIEHLLLYHADGSKARVSTTADAITVRETGPTALWKRLEQAHELWVDLGRPDRTAFQIEADSHGQRVRLGERQWPLPL